MIRKRASRKTDAYLSRDIIEDTDDSEDDNNDIKNIEMNEAQDEVFLIL